CARPELGREFAYW
nr:immunoglobulin heavy chain junction region [Mus musculus]MBK4184136.1 immunoglobulin heavy chain junction region [Mus musculus]MBK4196300.1 immunoglobulin heavy chain junction region [Mus musculus]